MRLKITFLILFIIFSIFESIGYNDYKNLTGEVKINSVKASDFLQKANIPENVLPGKIGFWYSGSGMPAWITLILKEPKEINAVYINFGLGWKRQAIDYKIQIWDPQKKVWVTCKDVTDNKKEERIDLISSCNTQKLRLYVLKTYQPDNIQRVDEIRLFNLPSEQKKSFEDQLAFEQSIPNLLNCLHTPITLNKPTSIILEDKSAGLQIAENSSHLFCSSLNYLFSIDKSNGFLSSLISFKPTVMDIVKPMQSGMAFYVWCRDPRQQWFEIFNGFELQECTSGVDDLGKYLQLSGDIFSTSANLQKIVRGKIRYHIYDDVISVKIDLNFLDADTGLYEIGLLQAYEPSLWNTAIYPSLGEKNELLAKDITYHTIFFAESQYNSPQLIVSRGGASMSYPYGVLQNESRYFLWGYRELGDYTILAPGNRFYTPSFWMMPQGMNEHKGHSFELIYKFFPKPENTYSDVVQWYAKKVYSEKLYSDKLGEQEIAAIGDPSFKSVSIHFPKMKVSRELIGVKEHPEKFAITPDGAIDFRNGYAYFQVGTPPTRFGFYPNGLNTDIDFDSRASATQRIRVLFDHGDPEFAKKNLWKGYLPIVTAEYNYNGLQYEQTAFGYSEMMSPDSDLFVYIRLKIKNLGNQARTEKLSYYVHKGDEETLLFSKDLNLDVDNEQSIFLKIPYEKIESNIRENNALEFNQHFNLVESYWENLLSKGLKIQVPEQRVNNAYKSWLAYNFLNVTKNGNIYEPHEGVGFYENIYGYTAARYCYALDLMGYHNEAQKYLDSLVTFIDANGLFVVNFGLLDTGSLLFAISEHYLLTGDKEWLATISPYIIKMCDGIIRLRKQSIEHQDKNEIWYGLIKYKPYCDYATTAYCYLTDCYLVKGMEETSSVLKDIGLEKESARIEIEVNRYRQDIQRSMVKGLVHDKNLIYNKQILPCFPETQELLKNTGYVSTDYYGLVASMLLETNFFSPSEEESHWITDFMQLKGGLILGNHRFCDSENGIDHAYSYGYLMTCMKRNDIERVLLGFYCMLAYGMSRDTFSAAEVVYIRKGTHDSTSPMLYSNTQQLCLLRNMLVREENNDMIIGQAIPRHWLEEGKEVEVKDAPTHFGNISYTINSGKKADKMIVRIIPPLRKEPNSIKLYLRHPDNKSITQVKINGKTAKDFNRETITLSELNQITLVEVDFVSPAIAVEEQL